MDAFEALRETVGRLDAATRERALDCRDLRTMSNAVRIDGGWVRLTASQSVRLQRMADHAAFVQVRARHSRAVRVSPPGRYAPRLLDLLCAVDRARAACGWTAELGAMRDDVLHLRLVDEAVPMALHGDRANETGRAALHLRYSEDHGTVRIDLLLRRDLDGSAVGAGGARICAVDERSWGGALDAAELTVREALDEARTAGAVLALAYRKASAARTTVDEIRRATEDTLLARVAASATQTPGDDATRSGWGARFAQAARQIDDLDARVAIEQAIVGTLLRAAPARSGAGVAPALW